MIRRLIIICIIDHITVETLSFLAICFFPFSSFETDHLSFITPKVTVILLIILKVLEDVMKIG